MPHLSFYFARSNGTKEVKATENEIAMPLPAAEEEMEELTEEITSKAARFEDMDLEEESKQCVPMILPCTRRCSASADQPPTPYQGSNQGANEKRTMLRTYSSRTRLALCGCQCTNSVPAIPWFGVTASLGTHGYYKAHCEALVTQMDGVCLSLYKRVYPRWS